RTIMLVAFTALAASPFGWSQAPRWPVRSVLRPGIVTTRQAITPAGEQSVFSGRVYAVAFGRSDHIVYAAFSDGDIYKLDWRHNRVLDTIRGGKRVGMQGLVIDPVTQQPLLSALFSSIVGRARHSIVQLVRLTGVKEQVIADHLGSFAVGQVSAAAEKNAAGERYAGVALTFDNALAIVDVDSGKEIAEVKTGVAPFGVALNRAGTVAYVSNWGGRFPRPGDLTLPNGNHQPNPRRVVVDARGIASTGTVSRVDLVSLKVTNTIETGLHPTALYWDQPRSRLYVADSNSDSVSVINTQNNQVAETIALHPFRGKAPGIAPNALAVSPGGETLYVACGGINAVAVIQTATGRLEGLIPTAWYPDDLRLSNDGKYLLVANLMGVGPGGTPRDIAEMAREEGLQNILPGPSRRYVHSDRSSVEVIPLPDAAQLETYTAAVAENNRLALLGSQPAPLAPGSQTAVAPLPVPLRGGEPSLIHHVVFIITENRTYDQVLGDMSQGNGDPTLVEFGREVTTNHHRLANQFVLLDNFYADGGNSADGHQWLTQAAETDYCYWPGYAGRSYPYDGADPIAPASSGFIWNDALTHGQTVEDFGEYVPVPYHHMSLAERATFLKGWKSGAEFLRRFHTIAPSPSLNKLVAHDYPYWTLAVPDVVRAQIFLKHLRDWEHSGAMPNLVLVQLPCDHTAGARAGVSTAKAMAADNDLGLGEIVDGLSHSPFWKSMAIFMVEDDAQDGIDHVDGHRTVALAISPYIRRGMVDSTFYSQVSILKTIEEMLGMPPLSIFDRIANDMRNSFETTPDFTPYNAVRPVQSLFATNPPAGALTGAARAAALASAKMNFGIPDAAPTQVLNRIIWHETRGWGTPYPQVRQGVFAPYAVDLDDLQKLVQSSVRCENLQ
ncbi:MAG: bifunctional YncE family protein/alkaline phosphatase family protein, partial [Terriglobia bacterium]